MSSRTKGPGKSRRKLLEGVICPRCGSDAIYRYGKSAAGRRRFLCQACRRQFTLKPPGRIGDDLRPPCPACAKPMHIYMRAGALLRFRCADYPRCRTYLKGNAMAFFDRDVDPVAGEPPGPWGGI